MPKVHITIQYTLHHRLHQYTVYTQLSRQEKVKSKLTCWITEVKNLKYFKRLDSN